MTNQAEINGEELRAIAMRRAMQVHGRTFWYWMVAGAGGFVLAGLVGTWLSMVVLAVVAVGIYISHRRIQRKAAEETSRMVAALSAMDMPLLYVRDCPKLATSNKKAGK